ncbi:hypothetical protein [Aeromicrobium duanguangcaii]|uniref:hypothetical protein n=1 Tax=Aeromicrobium duanguangcaii TaxID=2968086 RepID=UPI002016E234|nr:hypothetical protein [Aeromicrobium duanguangcaii]MCL3838726.1 hypothetical protein [Aeromicrobium duanguangcaii]
MAQGKSGSSGTTTSAPTGCANRHGQYPVRPDQSPGPAMSPERTTADGPAVRTACSHATFAAP